MARFIGEVKVVIEADTEDEASEIFEEVLVDHLEEVVSEDGRVLRFFGVDVSVDA